VHEADTIGAYVPFVTMRLNFSSPFFLSITTGKGRVLPWSTMAAPAPAPAPVAEPPVEELDPEILSVSTVPICLTQQKS